VEKNDNKEYFELLAEDLLNKDDLFGEVVWKLDKRLLWLAVFRADVNRAQFSGPAQRSLVLNKTGWAGVQKYKAKAKAKGKAKAVNRNA
jgi:hypothetical protein